MYDAEIDSLYEQMISANKDMNYIKISLIKFFKKLIDSGYLKKMFQPSEIMMIEEWLNKASIEVYNKNELESLIDSRCKLWEYHYSCVGNKKGLLRVLLYTMYSYKLEGYDDDLYELIANIVEDLAALDTRLADKFIQNILTD